MILKTIKFIALISTLSMLPQPSFAQSFSVLVNPPRIEDKASLGKTYRNVLSITNASNIESTYSVKTADWEFNDDNSVLFHESNPDSSSCRPFVYLQSREITLGPAAKKNFRFEVRFPDTLPSDMPAECRFAILIEGLNPVQKLNSPPVSGRIAVIVYLKTDNAKAIIHKVSSQTTHNIPSITFKNSGSAHARLNGFLRGTDSSNKSYVFYPGSLPILPGKTREILFYPQPDQPDSPPPTIIYPVTLKGSVDFGDGSIDIEETFR